MAGKLLVEFFAVESLLIMGGFFVAAFLLPPDPYSQLLSTVVILAVTLPLSYWLVYRRGIPS
ncbi:DUF7534 family protein [Haloarcula laminariae]|uniref:DUF7534 family protein n=1 Tax=Haloarcula laminariae TaxID=2961577 RepID=UPI0021C7E005|nr:MULTISPECIES: hypothetical protein [Halomicroarcula]